MALSLDAFSEDSKFSLALGLGNSHFQLNKANIVADYGSLSGASTFTDSSTAFSIVGGLQLDQYLSLETDILIAGDISAREAGQTIKLFNVNSTMSLGEAYVETWARIINTSISSFIKTDNFISFSKLLGFSI